MPWNEHSVVKAPHAAALYAEAIAMPHSYVHRWCTPTRAALMTGRFAFRNGWNTYGNVNQCGKQCGDACCPGQQGYAEELSSVPLAFEIMPKMLKRGGCERTLLSFPSLPLFSVLNRGVADAFAVGCCARRAAAVCRCHTHARKVCVVVVRARNRAHITTVHALR